MLKLALFQILQLFEGWVYHVVIVQLFIVKKNIAKTSNITFECPQCHIN
jgi:hypothetical protein